MFECNENILGDFGETIRKLLQDGGEIGTGDIETDSKEQVGWKFPAPP